MRASECADQSSLISALRGILAALTIAVVGPGLAYAGIPCSEGGAPVCGGACPGSQRCLPTVDTQALVSISVTAMCIAAQPERRETAAANGSCECVDVSCGGAPLGPNQGCCNGRPFTLGTQGCCSGMIVAATDPCDCDGNAIDLATMGCCGEEDAAQAFDPSQTACCQKPVEKAVDGVSCAGMISTVSSFNLGFDCCPGPAADQGEFCGGECVGSECATTGCCQCADCVLSEQAACAAGGGATIEGIEIACIVGCFAEFCFESSVAQLAGGMCTEQGVCVSAVEPVPAASHGGLALVAGLLAALGWAALAWQWKRRRQAV